ncbi:Histone deacetylase HOS3 [Ceratocystis fimbriata CBS 114723]|uniref:Histone deacetylase HOS3 n=1 Tax=Ceratocystis fimbriata CBS 114723 TaxID=1035309 RepID=A0A2C5X9G7_9PEZI|nr:Histone deacetylase HOS3 [Ceratocystis fimbriata CBS 114723]
MPPPSRPASSLRRSSLAATSTATTTTITTAVSASPSHYQGPPTLVVRTTGSSLSSVSPRTPTLRSSISSSSLRSGTARPPPPSPSSRMQSSNSPAMGRSSSLGSRSNTPTLHRRTSTSSLHSVSGSTPIGTPTRRASGSGSSALSPMARSPLALHAHPPPTIDEAPSAEDIAADHFRADLATHGSPEDHRTTELVVVLNDACYGHRFSRPRTSRNALNTIVERPERVRAAAVGVAMAYVRLGGRYADGHNPVHPRIHPTSINRIPFRVRKTDRKIPITAPAVTNVHGIKWMEELKIMCNSAEAKLAFGGKELQRPDVKRDPEAGGSSPAKFHEGDLYLCAESLDAFEGALGAVCEAVDLVFSAAPRRAFVGVRPPGHHCSASYPSGFCWINNVHVGIMHAAMSHGLTHAAIIDIDLHHGDGSQAIAWQHNKRANSAHKNASAWKKSQIGYFSLHDINSYPCEMGDEEKVKNASICIDGAHGQNIWNIHLQPWKTEADFWKLYQEHYLQLLDKARKFLKSQAEKQTAAGVVPKAAIFISAGFDASLWESAGMQRHNVNVPTEFYARIAQDVVRLASEDENAVDGRIISVMEGGYSDRALASGVLSHLSGLAGDQLQGSAAPPLTYQGLGAEMGLRIGLASNESDTGADPQEALRSLHSYDSQWWSSSELDKIETLLSPAVVEPKKPKAANASPTYCSPTHASNARKVEPRLRRSISNLSINAAYSRPETPPPPDVQWEVAAHELVKQLIPLDRTTESCTHEDLNAEATRARKEKQPKSEPVTPVRMSLRERRAKPIAEVKEGKEKENPASRAGRRRTVASASATGPAEKPPNAARTSRRVSTTSAMPPSTSAAGTREGSAPIPISTRPSTSMTIRTQPPSTLNVKKSRPSTSMSSASAIASTAESAPTKAPSRATRPSVPVQRLSAVSRAPSRAVSVAASVSSISSAATTRPSTTSPTGNEGIDPKQAADDSLDQITNGMRRIKINLITREQREARQRAEAEAGNSAGPRA